MHIETHPFPPVLPEHATVMMSGSFPPTADKRSMAFHYPNYQNDMWRVYGAIFYDDPKHFEVAGEKRFDAARIRAFLVARGIAIDVLREMLLSIFIAIASTDPFSLIEWYNPPIVIIA